MGGGLAFLNKKGWHPGSLRNQEAVWKKEQEKDAEDRKLDEFKQHVELERQKEELEGLAKAAGIKKWVPAVCVNMPRWVDRPGCALEACGGV